MVKLNMGEIDESSVEKGGEAIPLGEYVCEVVDAEEKYTKNSDPYFNFGLKVVEGEYANRYLGFDKMMFHTPGVMKRAKFILMRMGFDCSGDLDVEAKQLNGHFVLVKNKHTPKCPSCSWELTVAETKGLLKCSKDTCTWVGKASDAKMISEPDYAGYAQYDGAERNPNQKSTDFNPEELENGGTPKGVDEIEF